MGSRIATLISFRRGFRTLSNQVDTSYVSSDSITVCRNMVVLPKGHLAPRTEENLTELRRYVKRHFKKSNYNDKRTRAYRWMKQHDSEFNRGEGGTQE